MLIGVEFHLCISPVPIYPCLVDFPDHGIPVVIEQQTADFIQPCQINSAGAVVQDSSEEKERENFRSFPSPSMRWRVAAISVRRSFLPGFSVRVPIAVRLRVLASIGGNGGNLPTTGGRGGFGGFVLVETVRFLLSKDYTS